MYSPKSYSFKVSSANTDYTDAEVAYCDPKTGTTHKAKIKSNKKSRNVAGTEKTMTVQKRVENPEQAVALGKSELHAANAREQTSSLEIMGCPRIASGQMLKLEEFDEFSGDYFIASATHKVSGSGLYSTSLELTTPAPTEAESAHEEKSEAAEAAKEEVIIENIKRNSLSQEEKDRFYRLKAEIDNGSNEFHKLMIALPDIAAKLYDTRWLKKDRIGKIYLAEMLRKWFANRKESSAEIPPFYIDLDWVLSYGRANMEFMDFIQDSGIPYVLNKKARDSLCAILLNEDKVSQNGETYFDFINAPWNKLDDVYFTHRSVPGLAFWPDGLFSALESFTFRALASGYTEPCKNGKFKVHVKKIAVFTHDVFNFEGPMYLGSWFREFMDYTLMYYPNHAMTNGAFRNFAEQEGFGHNFTVLSKPRVIDFFKGTSYECTC